MNLEMQRPSLSDQAVARLIDPRTGQRLRPLGVVGGRNVYPIMGASPDDPSDSAGGAEGGGTDDDENENPEGKGSSSEDGEKGGDSDKGDKPEKGNPDAKIEDLEQEKERHYTRRKEAEKRADEAERQLRELKEKDKPEQEQLETRVSELETQNESLQSSLREALLDNAFLRDNTYSWHNPGRALRLADLSKVEIEDDGTVHGLKAALDALAKSDPYLISKDSDDKSKKDKKDLPDTSDKSNKSTREKKQDSQKTRDQELRQKYAALRR